MSTPMGSAIRMKLTSGVIVVAVAIVTGCGGSDDSDDAESGPSGAELASAWDGRAVQAYAAAGADRERDFAAGTVVEGCFYLDQAAGEAIGEVVGASAVELSDENFISGPPGEDESMTCTLTNPDTPPDDPSGLLSTSAGTTLADPDQFEARLLRREGPTNAIEGEAPGLDPANVVAVEAEGVYSFAWVSDDFFVGISAPAEFIGVEDGFAALSVAVGEVERTLLG